MKKSGRWTGEQDAIHQTPRSISEFYRSAWTFEDFIRETAEPVAESPYMVIVGAAGIGKSHLIADFVSSRIDGSLPAIFFLGQHFTTDDLPWTQILRSQFRLDCNEYDFLGA